MSPEFRTALLSILLVAWAIAFAALATPHERAGPLDGAAKHYHMAWVDELPGDIGTGHCSATVTTHCADGANRVDLWSPGAVTSLATIFVPGGDIAGRNREEETLTPPPRA